jgi:hypothetical protein
MITVNSLMFGMHFIAALGCGLMFLHEFEDGPPKKLRKCP